MRVRRPFSTAPLYALVVLLLGLLSAPLSAQQPDEWAGRYDSPHGVALELERRAGGYGGTLTVDGQGFPIEASASGRELRGSFTSDGANFPVTISIGEEPGQIVVASEGSMFELSRVPTATNPLTARSSRPANPLASSPANAPSATPAQSGTATTASGGNYRHPGGYFSMNLPADWEASLLDDDVLELYTGVGGDLVLVLLAELEPHEVGMSPERLMPTAQQLVDEFLAQNIGIQADSSRAAVASVQAGSRAGATSQRPAAGQGGRFTVWQGLVTEGESAFMLIAPVPSGSESRLIPALESTFASVQLERSWGLGEFSASDDSDRHVSFNGKRLSAQELAKLEGPTPMIPDGEYWYDNVSGMAGSIGGPTEAYLAPGLDIGGSLDANASGGGTNVAFNGRYLHPIDLAGLQYYFGEIRPGRYWLDGQGNYGQEGGPQLGNLVQEIAAVQAMAAEMQAYYQAQLNAQVQQYQGQGGYYGQGGGYYGQGGGGGSVYSHFPNLGASGTGVGVANVGGGDTIVNAGGVLWWPGK